MTTLSVNSTSSGDTFTHVQSDGQDHDQDSPLLPYLPSGRESLPWGTTENSWWRTCWPVFQRSRRPRPQRSGLYTIISMTDERLQPRRSWPSIVLSAFLIGLMVASVFFVTPRGVTVGSMTFSPHDWHKRSDHGTYTLKLGVHVGVYNGNYYPAHLSGEIEVLFLDVVAGVGSFTGLPVDARSKGQVLHVCMDASGVPVNYALTIIQMCMLYPQKLMFISRANFTVTTWLTKTDLPSIDTYFMLDCFEQTITQVDPESHEAVTSATAAAAGSSASSSSSSRVSTGAGEDVCVSASQAVPHKPQAPAHAAALDSGTTQAQRGGALEGQQTRGGVPAQLAPPRQLRSALQQQEPAREPALWAREGTPRRGLWQSGAAAALLKAPRNAAHAAALAQQAAPEVSAQPTEVPTELPTEVPNELPNAASKRKSSTEHEAAHATPSALQTARAALPSAHNAQ